MDTTNYSLSSLLAASYARRTPGTAIDHQTMLDPMSPSVNRQSLVRRLVLHGTALTATFDRVTRLAARALQSSYALVDIVDGNWVYIKSATSPDVLSNGLRMADHLLSYSLDVVKDGVPLIVNDMGAHPTLGDHPATRVFSVGAYLAVPLITADNLVLGTLAVMEHAPRIWSDADVATLRDCADIVREEIAAWAEMSNSRQNDMLSADLLWQVSEQLDEGLVVTDTTGQLLYANQRIRQLSGYALHELNDALIRDQLLCVDEQAADTQAMPQLQQGGRHELRFLHKDGTYWWAEVVSFPILEDGAQITLFSDITRRKQLETMLIASQKLECVGQLAMGTAHDFNNLLTIVLGSAQLAMSELTEDMPIYDDVDEIFRAARRAAGLTRQLLVFARHQPLEAQALNINELIVEIAKMLRRVIGSDIELVILPTTKDLFIEADPGQIEQMLLNLALNACDALSKGGKLVVAMDRVAVAADNSLSILPAQAGNYVQLVVRAVPQVAASPSLSHRFAPLLQGQDMQANLALRLATCHNIVRRYQGHLIYTQDQGEGERFSVYLPSIEEMPTVQDRSISIDNLPRGSETLLLVEDELSVRFLAARFLRVCGYNVLEASNGDDALRVIEQSVLQPIHLVLTDMVMPQMGGKELVERLRVRWPTIKVIVTSGYSDNEESGCSMMNLNVTFLPKPFLPSTLAAKVREVLDR